ncbi:class I SAM-dependent methyltransferase [Caldicellulosiruptor changbaiensis]|uniref:Class I SAM-dependent methyltransferase n=1 Tax=Caldicellulosiruptor changbaiensis TaxID=1222016 RepID=A0A3T0D7S0_9FIRM|nr:class I SAM-dependent methyltransferase [Caldicellulosiruptor changbaiensis]AZT91016.1 class I SAM-dependent methyltransferase [Caldicellulosiruptor changbaiensis]
MSAYDNIAWYYKRFSNVFFNKKLILRFLKNTFLEFGISKKARILDIGCGTGSILRSLAQIGFKKLYGIDISRQMIKFAYITNSSFNVRLYNKNFLDFVPRNKFDVVLSTMDVLNHVDKKDLLKYFENVRRVLRSNGLFIFDINLKEYLKSLGKREKVVKKVDDILFTWKFKAMRKKISINFSIADVKTAVHDKIIEYIYSDQEIEKFLKKSKFVIVKRVYDYNSPNKTCFCTKVCYVCKKI